MTLPHFSSCVKWGNSMQSAMKETQVQMWDNQEYDYELVIP